MVTKGRKKGTARFVMIPPGGAKEVLLSGDFSNWKTVPMQRQKNGSYVVELPLAAGTYEYKFIVDGRWTADPDNTRWSMNPHGTLNSIAQVT
jgi:1,4-alpha-glucan branching enzyme